MAFVGASPRSGSVGGETLRNIVRHGYRGTVYPVNPNYETVESLRCYSTIAALPEAADLAVLAVNRQMVLDVVRACADKGIANLVIVAAGFKESGAEGAALEEELRLRIDRFDMNGVGPNCMGIIHSVPAISLNASFSRWFPRSGPIAFVSQSGSVGETVLEFFEESGLGVSLFVNLGNRSGFSENEILAHLRDDPSSRAVFLYLESFADPGGFRSLLEEMSRIKPVIVLKAGRTPGRRSGGRPLLPHGLPG